MTPAARAADLARTHGLTPDALVVHAGADGTELLVEFRRLGCRVLALDSAAPAAAAGIDALTTPLTPAAARLVRDRYGPVALLLAASDVPPAVASICLSTDGVFVVLRDQTELPSLARAA